MDKKSAMEARPKTVFEYIELLKSVMDEDFFSDVILRLKTDALKNDKLAWAVIYQIIRDVENGKLYWNYHKKILSSIFYLLSEIGDSQSYRIAVNYLKNADRAIPIGAVELIAHLLPSFKELDIDELIQMVDSENSLSSAAAIFVLEHLIISRELSPPQKTKLESILKNYKNFRVYTDDSVNFLLDHLEDYENQEDKFKLDLDAFTN